MKMENENMKITVTKITNLSDAHLAIESTMRSGFTAKCSLDQLYRWEHSPSRTQLFWIHMMNIPTKVSVHLVRHAAVGQQHFVMSNRSDRGGAGDDQVTRNSPVNHRMLLNAQHLIDMSRKRLCYQASKETRNVMLEIQKAVEGIDSVLANYMVPNCVYRGGYCCEPKPCGQYNIKRYDPTAITKKISIKDQESKIHRCKKHHKDFTGSICPECDDENSDNLVAYHEG